MRIAKYFISLLLIILLQSVSFATVTTLQGTTDSYDNELDDLDGDPGVNKGTNTTMQLDYPFTSNRWQNRILLKFDTSGISSTDTVSSADLSLYLDSNGCDDGTPDIYVAQMCKTGWQENDSHYKQWDVSASKEWGTQSARSGADPCTENTTDAGGDDIRSTAEASITPVCTAWQCSGCSSKWYTFDITDIVQDWVDGTLDWNGGLLLHGEDGTSSNVKLYWRSSEHSTSSTAPKLVITHTSSTSFIPKIIISKKRNYFLDVSLGDFLTAKAEEVLTYP